MLPFLVVFRCYSSMQALELMCYNFHIMDIFKSYQFKPRELR